MQQNHGTPSSTTLAHYHLKWWHQWEGNPSSKHQTNILYNWSSCWFNQQPDVSSSLQKAKIPISPPKNQQIWKICSSNWIISPNRAKNKKTLWNHHLENIPLPKKTAPFQRWRIRVFRPLLVLPQEAPKTTGCQAGHRRRSVHHELQHQWWRKKWAEDLMTL